MKTKSKKSNFEFRINYRGSLVIILLIFCSLNSNLLAQSVDSLINEAIINNPLIKSLDYRIKSSEYRANSADAMPPPTVGFEISQMPFNSINLFSDPMSQNLTFSQMFPLGGKINAMVNAEKSNISVNIDNLSIYQNTLIGNIKMLYYSLWLTEKKIDVQKESIALLNHLMESITKLYEISRINQADLFTVKSEIAFNETQLVILKNQKEADLYQMNKLLGRDLTSKKLIVNKDISIREYNITLEESEQMLAERNPYLKKMNSMSEMNKYEMIANDKEKIPDLMLQGMVMRMPRGMTLTTKTSPDMIDGKGSAELGYGVMASITLPMMPWSKGKFEAKEQELQANIQSIEFERNDMLREMNAKLKMAFVKMNTSFDLIKMYSENVIPLYEKARSSQVSLYQNSQTNINMVIDANRMILMQTMNYYMAQADYQMAIAEIEMMVGIKIIK